jgi:hypothetical protein
LAWESQVASLTERLEKARLAFAEAKSAIESCVHCTDAEGYDTTEDWRLWRALETALAAEEGKT